MSKLGITTVAMSVQFECDVKLKRSGDYPNDAYVFTIEDYDLEFPNQKDAEFLVFPGDDERHDAIQIYIEKNIDEFKPSFIQTNLKSDNFLSVDAIYEIKKLRCMSINVLMEVIDVDKMIKGFVSNTTRRLNAKLHEEADEEGEEADLDDQGSFAFADCFGSLEGDEIVVCIGGGKKMYVYRIN
jgi:hypothetical protein